MLYNLWTATIRVTEIVARKIIRIGKRAGTPDEIAQRAIKELGIK